MKRQLIIAICAVLLFSCDRKDDFDGNIAVFDPPSLADSTPVLAKVKAMYNSYGVLFKPSFPQSEYSWNWDNSIQQTMPDEAGLRYTPADQNYAVAVMDSVDSWVFKVLGTEFIRKYMSLNILMTDTMESKHRYQGNIVHRMYEGLITTNYILVSYVSARFDAEKEKRMLRESWFSLFIEKMLPRLPAPAEFNNVSKDGYSVPAVEDTTDVAMMYAILKKAREKQNGGSPEALWPSTSPAQDFGDFAAFIVFTPDTAKQTVYNKNPDILLKVNMVKKYFKDNFDITLPYIPTP